jgi:serine/threonine protein kinase
VLKAMKALYDTAVMHKTSWRAATPKADTLSPQLAALLDRMLEPNPVKRFSMQQVAASEWLHMGLPPKLQVSVRRVHITDYILAMLGKEMTRPGTPPPK